MDSVPRVYVKSGQVISSWVFEARYMSQDEVKLEIVVAVIPPQFGRNSLRLDESCEGFVVSHDYRRLFYTPQDMCEFITFCVIQHFCVHRE